MTALVRSLEPSGERYTKEDLVSPVSGSRHGFTSDRCSTWGAFAYWNLERRDPRLSRVVAETGHIAHLVSTSSCHSL